MNVGDARRWYTKSGTIMGRASWLDIHFEALRPEYERSVEVAGFEPGWHILDAGTGGGSFVPLLAEQVGGDGKITAIDLDLDNVRRVHERFGQANLPCAFSTEVADITRLQFPDETFDAVWLANVLMYMSGESLPVALEELRRVVRPGGIVVAKEGDNEILRCLPLPKEFRSPFHHMDRAIPGAYQARLLPAKFSEAGFIDVRAQTIFCERWAPLRDVERQYLVDLFRSFSAAAGLLEMDDAERAYWQEQAAADSPDAILNRPDFAFCAAHVVTIGRVPAA